MKRLDGETDIAIVVSPMKRTLQTALASLDWLIERGVPITADASWQGRPVSRRRPYPGSEVSVPISSHSQLRSPSTGLTISRARVFPALETTAKPCDTGSPVSELAAEFPSVDFSAVDPVFPDKTSPFGRKYAPYKGPIVARGQSCLRDLYQRREKWVIVVSHGGFMRAGVIGWWFFNGDYRILDFVDDHHAKSGIDEPLRMVQWDSTLRGGLGLSWPEPVEIGAGLEDDTPDDSVKTL
jgi:hypothetical protein